MHPQMMAQQQQAYDPYQFYGLERRRSAESRQRPTAARAPAPEIIPSPGAPPPPAVTKITDIGSNDSPRPNRGVMDPLDYAKELRRQVEEKESIQNPIRARRNS